jgi:hypothetical protein
VAYDEGLADRIREALRGRSGVTEKKMFGGLAFMFEDRMAVGIGGEDLMVRVGPEGFGRGLADPHARPMDFSGRPMVGDVYVDPEGVRTADRLRAWLERGIAFMRTVPARRKPPRRPKDR